MKSILQEDEEDMGIVKDLFKKGRKTEEIN